MVRRCGSSELTSEEIDLLRQASARSAAADGSGGESGDKFKKWGKKAWMHKALDEPAAGSTPGGAASVAVLEKSASFPFK